MRSSTLVNQVQRYLRRKGVNYAKTSRFTQTKTKAEEAKEMIQRADQRKRDRKRRAKAAEKLKMVPKPEWVEAFLVLLLAKAGGKASLSLEKLEMFSKVKGENPTELTFDEGIVTLSLKGVEKSDILIPDNRIIP